MDYIEAAFKRMSLRQIRDYILCGTGDLTVEAEPYLDRLKNESDPIRKRLESLCPNWTERDKAAAELSQALSAYEGVYMELGMKAGARLIWQLLLSDDRHPAERSGL